MNASHKVRWRIVMPALAAALLYCASACAECVLPAAPSRVPDGRSATEQEMVAAMRTLKQYNDDVTEYTECLEFEEHRNRLSVDVRDKRKDLALNTLAA